MLFWTLALLMMAVAALFVLLPLARRGKSSEGGTSAVDVYLKQLAEIDRKSAELDQPGEELLQERAEIARRVLKHERLHATSPRQTSQNRTNLIVASASALVLLPTLSIGTYLYTGSPMLKDQPLSLARGTSLENRSIEDMVLMAERHLVKNPDDIKGWTVLAGVYGRTNRPSDKARALRELIRLSGRSPALLTDLGEALTVAAGEVVPARARKLFEESLALQPDFAKASLYLAVAEEQEGKYASALARWQKLAVLRPGDQQWQTMTGGKILELRNALSESGQALSGPSREDVEDAAKLSQSDRMAMIEGMVGGLAAKLEDEPDNLAGWMRLIRSYSVLGKPDSAGQAYQAAMTQFTSNPDAVAQLQGLAGQLGLPQTTAPVPAKPTAGETVKEDKP